MPLAPNRDALVEISNRLKENQITFALGGSGLVSFYGGETEIHDWDITTDASVEQVQSALEGLKRSSFSAPPSI